MGGRLAGESPAHSAPRTPSSVMNEEIAKLIIGLVVVGAIAPFAFPRAIRASSMEFERLRRRVERWRKRREDRES